MAILELFDLKRRALSQREIRDALDLAPSSANALLQSLVQSGYLDYDRERLVYFPTMRIAALGRWVERALLGDGLVVTLMERLMRETGQMVMLAAQSDLHAQYIHILHEDPLRFIAPPGTLRPIAQSGAGIMLLADKMDREIEKLWRRVNAAGGHRIELAAVMDDVNMARDQGYFYGRDRAMQGGSVIAFSLPRRSQAARPLVITIGGQTADLDRNLTAIVATTFAALEEYRLTMDSVAPALLSESTAGIASGDHDIEPTKPIARHAPASSVTLGSETD